MEDRQDQRTEQRADDHIPRREARQGQAEDNGQQQNYKGRADHGATSAKLCPACSLTQSTGSGQMPISRVITASTTTTARTAAGLGTVLADSATSGVMKRRW